MSLGLLSNSNSGSSVTVAGAERIFCNAWRKKKGSYQPAVMIFRLGFDGGGGDAGRTSEENNLITVVDCLERGGERRVSFDILSAGSARSFPTRVKVKWVCFFCPIIFFLIGGEFLSFVDPVSFFSRVHTTVGRRHGGVPFRKLLYSGSSWSTKFAGWLVNGTASPTSQAA